MSVLYWLENLRCPVLDFFFSTVTLFGEETLVVVVAMILFWCFDKKQGYFLFFVSFFGTVCNLFLKAWFRVPRPWVKDPSFTVVEAAKDGPFISRDDFWNRTKVPKTVIEKMHDLGLLGDLPQTNQISLFDMFE